MLIAMAIHDTPENGRDQYTAQTLESLALTVDWSRHRIWFVCNAATERTTKAISAFMAQLPPETADECGVIFLPENIGTARAINKAWAYRQPGEHAVKMDNDVVIHGAGWADDMVEIFEKDSRAGIIGLKRKDCIQNPDHPDPFYRSVLQYIPRQHGDSWLLVEKTADVMGTCTGFSSALLDKIGYLYQPGLYGYDDVLACVRSLCAGFYNAFLPAYKIDHIDHGGTEYQKWKERSAGGDSPTYHTLKSGYMAGQIPIYYGPNGDQ